MRHIVSILAAGGIALAAVNLTPPSPAAAQTAACKINGPAEQYNVTVDDFGRGGGAPYTLRNMGDYWSGQGHLIGFQRASGDAMESSPWGAVVFSGVIVAADEQAAASDMDSAVSGWTEEWKAAETQEVRSAAQVGDDMRIVRRLTWEIANQDPMAQVFLAFRRCNVSAHIDLTVNPDFDPIAQAVRYASIINGRLGG